MIKLGTSDVTPKIGSADVEKVFLGTTEVYSGVGDTYDAEVEYVSFDGTQTLTIPTSITADDVIELDCLCALNGKSVISFGSNTNDSWYCLLNVFTSSSALKWWGSASLTGSGSTGVRHVYTLGRKFLVDGVSQGNPTVNRPLVARDTINLFSQNTSMQKGNLYSLKVTGKLDLIPVRVGTGGYVYDKTQKKLHGDGSLVVGPDVSV